MFNSNLALICGCDLTISIDSLILRLPIFRTIPSILTEKFFSLFLHFSKCLWNEDARVLICSLTLTCSGLMVLPI